MIMRRAGFKSEGARATRQTVRDEMAERLEGAGIRIGGFGDSLRAQMSPATQRRIAEAEAAEAYEAAKQERERAVRAQAWQERSEELARRTAVDEALAAGEDASPRALRGERLGHEPHEFLALMSARQDHEDMVLEAKRLEYLRRCEAAYDAGDYADNSAPTQRQLEADELMRARAARYRARHELLSEARQQARQDAARGDRQVLGRVAAAAAVAFREPGHQSEYRTEYTA
jgi:hypothetical protein